MVVDAFVAAVRLHSKVKLSTGWEKIVWWVAN